MSVLSKLHAHSTIVQVSPSSSSTHGQRGNQPFLATLEPGRQLRASVQSSLSNGEFVVALDAHEAAHKPLLHMRLPAGARPGDILNLIFVSRNPRPAFMLTVDKPNATISAPLSATGRFISDLLVSDLLGRSTSPDRLLGLSGKAPLLPAPPPDGVQLARNLAHALGQSGLFYESHQAQWIAGERPMADLLLEPQAPLAGLRPHSPDTTAARGALLMTAMPSDNAVEAHAPVHPDALALVRQQLEVFETRQIVWQGVAWPGQTIEWEVAEEKYAQPDGNDESGERREAPAAWQTRLKLALPNLGQISASLRLEARGVEVRLTAADPVTAFMLRAGAAPLANGLKSAGIELIGMGVDLDEAARSA